MTYLETRSVRGPTMKDYQTRLDRFKVWTQKFQLPLDSPENLDLALVEYIQDLFDQGRKIDDGIRTHAAIRFFHPSLGRPMAGTLPRTLRALKGWSLASPSQQRLPLPLEVLGAVIGFLATQGMHQLGLRLFLQFVTYMRPGECSNLLVKQMVAPQQTLGDRFMFFAILLHPSEDKVPGKTGVFDASVVLDSDAWMYPLLTQLGMGKTATDVIWDQPHNVLVDQFAKALEALNLTHLNSCLYTLRHGGATHDILTRRRSMMEVKQRGRWGSDSSLKRYVKLARLQTELAKVPIDVRNYGLEIIRSLPKILTKKMVVPPIPHGISISPSACSRKKRLSRSET